MPNAEIPTKVFDSPVGRPASDKAALSAEAAEQREINVTPDQ